MIGSQEVTRDVANASGATALANLLESYVHDLSGIIAIDIGADGRFGYDRRPPPWSDPDTHFAFCVRVGGEPAGFPLVTRGSPATDDPTDLDVAKFFILRSHRRARVGRGLRFCSGTALRAALSTRLRRLRPPNPRMQPTDAHLVRPTGTDLGAAIPLAGEEVTMRPYVQLSGLLFGLVAIGHLVRVVRRWPLLIAGYPVPALASLVVLVVTGLMAVWAWRLLSRREAAA